MQVASCQTDCVQEDADDHGVDPAPLEGALEDFPFTAFLADGRTCDRDGLRGDHLPGRGADHVIGNDPGLVHAQGLGG